MKRLRIVLEFNPNNEADYNLYCNLMKYTSASALIKDILKGNISLSSLNLNNYKGV